MYNCRSVLIEAHGFDAFFVPGLIWVKGEAVQILRTSARLHLSPQRCARMLWKRRISSFFFLGLFPCLCSNSYPHCNRQEDESERKVIGMQRQCIYNYNAYLVTMLKQRPPSPHARENSFPPSHSHDAIAASPGCTVFLLFITHVRCQLHCFSCQHTCSHSGEEEEKGVAPFSPPPSSSKAS